METALAYTLPPLPYAYDALEPHIDALTMEIHHSKHHQTYVNNLNAALEGAGIATDEPVEALVARIDQLPEPSVARCATTAAATPTTACSGRSCRHGRASPTARWPAPSTPNWADTPPSAKPSPRRR